MPGSFIKSPFDAELRSIRFAAAAAVAFAPVLPFGVWARDTDGAASIDNEATSTTHRKLRGVLMTRSPWGAIIGWKGRPFVFFTRSRGRYAHEVACLLNSCSNCEGG